MIFHWIDDEGKVYLTREFRFGYKLIGLKYNNKRPDYVIISDEEYVSYVGDAHEYLLNSVRHSLIPLTGKIYVQAFSINESTTKVS